MSNEKDWQQSLAQLRARQKGKKPEKPAPQPGVEADLGHVHGRDAIMTLVTIMKDESDPRLQITAAKALLDRGIEMPVQGIEPQQNVSMEEIDAAIALAKEILDELAARKAGSMDGKGAVDFKGTPQPDHP